MNTKQAAAAAVIAAVIISAVIITYIATKRLSSTGTIKTLGIEAYTDSTCTMPALEIDWGSIGQGETAQATIYLKLKGNLDAVIQMNTAAPQPQDAFNYLTLTWNCTNYLMHPDEAVCAVLSLTVVNSLVPFTDFSFDIVITATH